MTPPGAADNHIWEDGEQGFPAHIEISNMAPSGIQNHSDQALILNKEVYRHVRQRRRRRRGGGSVQYQLEVQQIDTFDSGDTFGSGGGGHGQEH